MGTTWTATETAWAARTDPLQVDATEQPPKPDRGAKTNRPMAAAHPTTTRNPAVDSVTTQNCDAVGATGRAPQPIDEPGYIRKRATPGEGIACE